MRKSFRPDKSLSERNPGWQVPRWRAWLLVLVVVLVLAVPSLIRQGLESPVTLLARPALFIDYWLHAKQDTFWDYLSRQEALVAENASFRTEVNNLKSKLLAAEQVTAEYRELRQVLGRLASDQTGVIAKVVSSPSRSPYDVVFLDVGEDNAALRVMPGQLISVNNILLGTVEAVFPRLSRGRLFSSPRQKLEVNLGPEAIPVTIVGTGGGNFVASLPRIVTITPGDLASVPALGSRVVAQVGVVDNNPEEPFQTVYLKTPVNIFTLDWVIIHDF